MQCNLLFTKRIVIAFDGLELISETPIDGIFDTFMLLYQNIYGRDAKPRSDLVEALSFAIGAHSQQKRKNGNPYIHHPLSVWLITALADGDVEEQIAALCHDILEDVPEHSGGLWTREALEDYIHYCLGPEVHSIVASVTNPDDFGAQGKEGYMLNHIPQLEVSGQKLKMADGISNGYDAGFNPAPSWSISKLSRYLQALDARVRVCSQEVRDHAFLMVMHQEVQKRAKQQHDIAV